MRAQRSQASNTNAAKPPAGKAGTKPAAQKATAADLKVIAQALKTPGIEKIIKPDKNGIQMFQVGTRAYYRKAGAKDWYAATVPPPSAAQLKASGWKAKNQLPDETARIAGALGGLTGHNTRDAIGIAATGVEIGAGSALLGLLGGGRW